jgi:hypothetical protein
VSRPLIIRTIVIDPQEMAERGRRGGLRTQQLHDSEALAARAREAFDARFARADDPAAARRSYFSALGKIAAARRRALEV